MRSGDTSSTRSPTSTSAPELPADRAFVVQFRGQAPREGAWRAGRVEHVVSGRTIQFGSWEQLRAFVEDMLDDGRSR